MEFLKVSENKLKIMLDSSDMESYGMDELDSDSEADELRLHLWEMLDMAKKSCGFHVNGEKLLVQLYPSLSGGEIFVTKLGAISRGTEKALSSSRRVTMLNTEAKLLRFDDLATLSHAVYTLLHSLPADTKAYAGEGGVYFLSFVDRYDIFPIASEFGKSIPASLEGYIREHSIPISRPLETLSGFHKG